MRFNICKLYPEHNVEIEGVSYIGNPKEYTAMYVSKKVGYLVENLRNCGNCLIFAENGIEVASDLKKNNCFIFSSNPQLEYAKFANALAGEKQKQEAQKKYILTKEGYYIGENVEIGINAYIEPECLIGHGVIIGDNARILSGCIVKNAIIGDCFVCNERAVVGAPSFTMTEDEEGNKYRIPTLGSVYIGDHVEVGTSNTICAGACGNTILEDYVKLDGLVHIGHEAHLGKNTELTAGTIIAGFAVLGENTYGGINSSIKNRISIGSNSIVGMGAAVIKDVPENVTVAGNPARILHSDLP